jgi:hypothetical protein
MSIKKQTNKAAVLSSNNSAAGVGTSISLIAPVLSTN